MSWPASIELEYRKESNRISYRSGHSGPLLVQKPFYSPDRESLHHYILHPPGGVVAGDELRTKISARDGTNIVLTSPSAQKIYRSERGAAVNSIELQVDSRATLYWLPQETILFEGCHLENQTQISLDPRGQLIYWDIFCLGRPAIEESFQYGRLRNELNIYQDDKLIFRDLIQFDGGSEQLESRGGFAGNPNYGQMIIKVCDDSFLDSMPAQGKPCFWNLERRDSSRASSQ